MARSARSSAIKKNKSGLKKRVFGPVETARNERLNAKLLELAQQPKAPRPDMDIEEECQSSRGASNVYGDSLTCISSDLESDCLGSQGGTTDGCGQRCCGRETEEQRQEDV